MSLARRAASRLMGAGWEIRRRAYAAGVLAPRRVAARVVSVGNLTVGGTGKTTLTLQLARRAIAAGRNPVVVCRNYRPGPGGWGDEALMLRATLGNDRVRAGASKRRLAEQGAAAGHDLILVDDGFSHWPLARDLDLVLLDSGDPWGGGALLPAGRLREPRRALQRAQWLVLSRAPAGALARATIDQVRGYAPAARIAAGRHRVIGVRGLGAGAGEAPRRVRVVTATGNPQAVAASAREIGLEVAALSAYRDHHWFRRDQVEAEREAARHAGAAVLLTRKDAVRWPADLAEGTWVLEVEWEWIQGGAELEAAVLGESG